MMLERSTNRKTGENFQKKYPVGKRVVVHYDPQNPNFAML